MITEIFVLSLIIYEIFANEINNQKFSLENKHQSEKTRNGTCAI